MNGLKYPDHIYDTPPVQHIDLKSDCTLQNSLHTNENDKTEMAVKERNILLDEARNNIEKILNTFFHCTIRQMFILLITYRIFS